MEFSDEHSFQERITENILEIATEGHIAIFTGAVSSGKSSFAKMIYLYFADERVCCVSLTGDTFTSTDPNKIAATVENAFIQQYDSKYLEEFRQLPNEQKVIIVDDVDNMHVHGERRNTIIDYLYGCFGKVTIKGRERKAIFERRKRENQLCYFAVYALCNFMRCGFSKYGERQNTRRVLDLP